MLKFPKCLRVRIERLDKESMVFTDLQKVCVHEWKRMGDSHYSHCEKCLLMRDDCDGDLINPLVYK